MKDICYSFLDKGFFHLLFAFLTFFLRPISFSQLWTWKTVSFKNTRRIFWSELEFSSCSLSTFALVDILTVLFAFTHVSKNVVDVTADNESAMNQKRRENIKANDFPTKMFSDNYWAPRRFLGCRAKASCWREHSKVHKEQKLFPIIHSETVLGLRARKGWMASLSDFAICAHMELFPQQVNGFSREKAKEIFELWWLNWSKKSFESIGKTSGDWRTRDVSFSPVLRKRSSGNIETLENNS